MPNDCVTTRLEVKWTGYKGYCERQFGEPLLTSYAEAIKELEEVTERRSPIRKREREQAKRFSPENWDWLKAREETPLRCHNMEVIPWRRQPRSDEAVSFLRGLETGLNRKGTTDDTGWLVYADWLDEREQDEQAKEVAGKIRKHISYNTQQFRSGGVPLAAACIDPADNLSGLFFSTEEEQP